MNNYEILADVIFPHINKTVEDLEKHYKRRDKNLIVSRFAPSPTGFLHTGSLFTAFIASKICKDNKGVFFLRIEDTDQKREVLGSKDKLVEELSRFNIEINEGYVGGGVERGIYGPYIQSKRQEIYEIVAKELIKQGRAYPCFCSEEENASLRQKQTTQKIRTGYYGEFAKCRDIDPLVAVKRIQNKEAFVLRFKSLGCHLNHIAVCDLVRGNLSLSENDLDIVLIKSDGLPTYHFAHIVDDHFMRTTHIIRGEEWLSSLPIHIELLKSLGFETFQYAHLPVILKVEGEKRRKLSKRYDQEAAVSYFLEEGYPVEAVLNYLLTIANSNYEEWAHTNLDKVIDDFKFDFSHMSLDGAVFDLEKINSISKDFLAKLSKEEISLRALRYAKEYDETLAEYIQRDFEYFQKIMGIERGIENPRKDYYKYSEIKSKIQFFYEYDVNFEVFEKYEKALIKSVLESFIPFLKLDVVEEDWLSLLKEKAQTLGFAKNNAMIRENPEIYRFKFASYMEIIRYCLLGKKDSPNLFHCLNILKEEEIYERLQKCFAIL